MTVAVLMMAAVAMPMESQISPEFASAEPVWPAGNRGEMNQFFGFRAVFDAPPPGPVTLRIAVVSNYRVFVNDRFLGHGPARGPHGFHRVDEWDLVSLLVPGQNVVAIEVAGYNTDSYYLPNQLPFLQAEIIAGSRVLAATGAAERGFEVFRLAERVQKVQRYSHQRTFSEVYRLTPGSDRWRSDPAIQPTGPRCDVLPKVPLLPRRVPYPDFALRQPTWQVARGTMKTDIPVTDMKPLEDFMIMGLKRGGFQVEELEAKPIVELAATATERTTPVDRPYSWESPLGLAPSEFVILDLGANLTGFVGARIVCQKTARLYVAFDEILVNGDVDYRRLSCANFVAYRLQPGTYDIESFEPYTARYLKFICLDGDCQVSRVYLREYANPDVLRASFAASDPRLNRLFAAGRETFRQNALDIFMDCPSRERAGWLCDSFFTARVAVDLSGNSAIERNFYENFLLPAQFKNLPEGMLPMCYPADHRPNSFIPNWAMWFVVELEEYLQRSGDREMVDALKPKVFKLFDYFKPLRNSDGLLEKLQSWVFVEWSPANSYVQDVNYPSNMLYAGTLAAAGRLYGMPDLISEADKIRETIRKQSFDGTFFVDNAVRKDGKLEVTRNRTETCQYYAFFFDVATPATQPKLWKTLCEQFGPKRNQTKAFPDIAMSNAFIGNMLRLELLSRHGLCRQLFDESIDYNLYMADRTGTLWENVHPGASCNHGFASHMVHSLYRDVLGLKRIDSVRRNVQVRIADQPLEWCEGHVPAPDGGVTMRWWREGEKTLYRLSVPAGYRIEVENLTGKELVARP